jgi:hypothetical protein
MHSSLSTPGAEASRNCSIRFGGQAEIGNSPLSEIARVLVRFDQAARIIVNAIKETEIPKLGSIAISTVMEICGLDIPAARRDFMATRAAALRDYACLAVLFNTTAAAFLFSRKRCASSRQSSRVIGFCLIRQSSASPIVCLHQSSRFLRTRRVPIPMSPNRHATVTVC